ncbi:MAG: sterol desaturase family protein [Gammaproteobacteria bacterium]|nr:sterol desaturase family protein [Gammaproteobacteria bacterium]
MRNRPVPEVEFRFGEGLISGYLSAFLGLLSLGGVLCFLFPEYLTTADVRASFDVQGLRMLLLATLTLAFVLGAVNHLFEKGRRCAMIGLASAFLATMLGGPFAEREAGEFQEISLGLDWFVISLLFSALIFIPMEKLIPHRGGQKTLRAEWQTDLTYFAVGHLFISVILLISVNFAPVFFGWAVSATLQQSVRGLPLVVQFVLVVFAADLAQYAVHRAYHRVPFLWRVHAIHHSAQAMDWIVSARVHIIEILMTRSFVLLSLYLLGFAPAALGAYVGLFRFHSVFIHANVGVNFGWLNYVLATPQYHHWHHSSDREAIDTNFAVHLPFIDMIFGTFRLPQGEWPNRYGVRDEEVPLGFIRQHLYPFRR